MLVQSTPQLRSFRGREDPTVQDVLDVGDEVLALACLLADEEQARWERVRKVELYS